jgi:hypothetical protein
MTMILAALVLVLPLMMGQRTADTMTASALLLMIGAVAATLLGSLSGQVALPSRGWLIFAGLFTAWVVLQVLPWPTLARLFGPYPEVLWQQHDWAPRTWSPDPGATLRGWAAFVALFTIAWLTSQLPRRLRLWLWITVVASALFQGVYGLLAHAGGATEIFGIWARNNVGMVHGSFSNRNLYAGYLALTWPLVAAIWFVRRVPVIHQWPVEVRGALSLISAGIVGAAMLGSASRLGAAGGVLAMALMLLLWGHHRQMIGRSPWPGVAAAITALVAATWYGLTPLATRLLATGEEVRGEVVALVLREAPSNWWLFGVGLGGFEAAFKQLQPGHIGGWWDYLHNDVLQFALEMGLMGVALLLMVAVALWRRWRLSTERAALYAGLGGMGIIALGDFSWHIPATQVVIAMMLGALLATSTRATRQKLLE